MFPLPMQAIFVLMGITVQEKEKEWKRREEAPH
jgi:hypothetical protein